VTNQTATTHADLCGAFNLFATVHAGVARSVLVGVLRAEGKVAGEASLYNIQQMPLAL